VPPDDAVAAGGTTCMVKPGHPTFIAAYGGFFTYPAGAFDGGAGPVDVTYSAVGTLASSSAWSLWADPAMDNFSVLPATDNQGLCGGPNICAMAVCPSTKAWNECHWDQVHVQQLFRR